MIDGRQLIDASIIYKGFAVALLEQQSLASGYRVSYFIFPALARTHGESNAVFSGTISSSAESLLQLEATAMANALRWIDERAVG